MRCCSTRLFHRQSLGQALDRQTWDHNFELLTTPEKLLAPWISRGTPSNLQRQTGTATVVARSHCFFIRQRLTPCCLLMIARHQQLTSHLFRYLHYSLFHRATEIRPIWLPDSASHSNPARRFFGLCPAGSGSLGPLFPYGIEQAVQKLLTADQRVDIYRAASSIEVDLQPDLPPLHSSFTPRSGWQAQRILCYIFFLKFSKLP